MDSSSEVSNQKSELEESIQSMKKNLEDKTDVVDSLRRLRHPATRSMGDPLSSGVTQHPTDRVVHTGGIPKLEIPRIAV